MAMNGKLPFVRWFAQSHAEYTIGPLEIHTSDIIVTAQWIEMEIVVLNTPRFIRFV